MSTLDKAARAIDQWTQEGHELNHAVGSPHAIAERLADAGLLAPDLPESNVERLRKAIQDEGPHPQHHRRKLEQLRREWPTLYTAITGLINEQLHPYTRNKKENNNQ